MPEYEEKPQPIKRTDIDFVDDSVKTIQNELNLIATTTQQLEGLITDEATPSDTDNKSTTAESSSPPEPINKKVYYCNGL